jgi:hypothetical protein
MQNLRVLGGLVLLYFSTAGCGFYQDVAFHGAPHVAYTASVPEGARGPVQVYFLRHLPETELVHTAWRDKLGPVDQTPPMYPRQPLPELVASYENRVEWAVVRHDELIQVPFGSMVAFKAYSALRRMYPGEAALIGDLAALEDIEANPYAHQIVVDVESMRFFEHPMNHVTLDFVLRFYAYPAGSATPQVIRRHVVARSLRLGGLFASSEDLLAALAQQIDAHVSDALQGMLEDLPQQAPDRRIEVETTAEGGDGRD